MENHVLDITDTISDAAAQILSHSFAVYRVDTITASKIKAAYRAATRFFNETSDETIQESCSNDKTDQREEQDLVRKYRRVKNGNLYGYNLPLPSKKLFRTWYHCDNEGNSNGGENSDNEYFRRQQPWPSNELCTASFDLVVDLHRLLSECLGQLLVYKKKNVASIEKITRQQLGLATPPLRKRFRGSSGIATEPEIDDGNATTSIREKKSTTKCPSFYPRDCPLDYFYYHNRFPGTINCSEHIDRGALVVVCLTDVPGLEVCPTASYPSSFHCPETLIHNRNLYRERSNDDCCPGLVCIMAGDQLSQLFSSTEAPRPCVHRVRNPLLRARLSISYELRLDISKG